MARASEGHIFTNEVIGLRASAIGIGSNSLRMLVADLQDAQLHRVLRDREGLRVFAALDEDGNISDEMIEKACHSVRVMQEKAIAYGATAIHLFATSAVRDARNQGELCEQLRRTTGLEPQICSGEFEARLSFMGATGSCRSGMIDIGGGSTEIVIGQHDQIDFATSLQMGAVRLYRVQPIESAQDAEKVVELARGILREQQERAKQVQMPEEWIGVGGTFTTTAALVQNVPWTHREKIHGFRATKSDIRLTMEHLAPMTMESRLQLTGLQPQRADIVVHGLAILTACMDAFGIGSIMVSEHGNLEGYLKYRYFR